MAGPRLPRLPPSAARIGQLRRRVTRNRRSNSGLGGSAASTVASMLIDFASGFFGVDLSSDKKSKLGMFGKTLGAGVTGGAVDNTPLPAMEKPSRVSNVSNPTFATISTQLDKLIKTANKIGLHTKAQQQALLNQIGQSKRIAKEQQLENKAPAIPELPSTDNSGSTLGPLDTSVDALIEKIDNLSETVDGLTNGSTGGMGGLPGNMSRRPRGGRAGAPPAAIVNAAPSLASISAAGPVGGAAPAAAPSFLKRAALAIGAGTAAIRTAAPVAMGAASAKVAGLMSTGFKATKNATGSIKAAVRRVAGPIIGKALGRTVLKSIPLVGLGVGAAYAVGRLMQGDVVGATVELGSGVAGPLTAVPALAASVTRDTYASVYGVQPEQDPNFKQRYPELKSAIEEMIKEQLMGAVKPNSAPTDREIGETETPIARPQAAPVASPPPVPTTTPPAGTSGSTPAAAAIGASTSGGNTASPAADAGMASSTSSAGTPQPTTTAAEKATLISPVPEMNTDTMNGSTITAQQMPVDSINQSYGYNPSKGMFVPQSGKTTRSEAQGVGNIPNPVYSASGLEDFMRTLFFTG